MHPVLEKLVIFMNTYNTPELIVTETIHHENECSWIVVYYNSVPDIEIFYKKPITDSDFAQLIIENYPHLQNYIDEIANIVEEKGGYCDHFERHCYVDMEEYLCRNHNDKDYVECLSIYRDWQKKCTK